MTTTGRSVSSARANRELITRRRASTRRRPADPPAGLMGTTEEERIPYPPRWLLVDRGVLPRTARRQNPSSQGPMESLGARSAVAPVAARAPVRAAKPARGVVVARARAAHDNKDASSSPADDIAKSAVAGACRAPPPPRGGETGRSRGRSASLATDPHRAPPPPPFGLLAARARDRAIRTRGALAIDVPERRIGTDRSPEKRESERRRSLAAGGPLDVHPSG